MNYTDPKRLEALAREYALGTLRGRARDRLERIMRENPAATRLVGEWEQRLEAMGEPLEPVRPPARVWRKLNARLGGPVVAHRRPLPRAFHALAASVAALLVVAGAFFAGQSLKGPEPLSADFVSIITTEDGADVWLVQVYDDAQEVSITVTGAVPALTNQVYQLWMLPEDDNPRSLGLLPSQGTLSATISRAALGDLARSANLAVSTEPPGGSPTGQPTGDVVFVAALATS